MPADFPVPRSEIPRVEVSQDEYVARKLQMDAMVEKMVQEFEEYSDVNKRHINTRRWKHIASRERCKLFRERPKYQTPVGALGAYNHRKNSHIVATSASTSSSWDVDASEDSISTGHSGTGNGNDGPMSTRSSTSSSSSNDVHIRPRRPSGSTGASTAPPAPQTAEVAESLNLMLMIGERPGRLEDAMHALVARNHDELAFVVVFLHQEVADCAILATMESPTEDEPYRYLGYKWFVKPSPAPGVSRLVKNRDSLYVEYTGVTATRSGEIVGFHIMHSIDIDGFPNFHERNCVRASQSMCSLYFQKEENMVEFFMMGNVDVGGTVESSPLAGMFKADTLFGMPRSIDAGKAKRLTALVKDRRRSRNGQGPRPKLAPLCRLCRSEKKSFNLVSLSMCEICGDTVCSRCRVHKRVFESDGILGKFNKFVCCKTCVVEIANTHLPPAKPRADRMRVPVAQAVVGRVFSARRHWSTVSSTVYEDEPDHNQIPVHHAETHGGNPQPYQYKTLSSRGKLSVASTVLTDETSGSIAHEDDADRLEFDPTKSAVSDISDFDRSFAILTKDISRMDVHRETTASHDLYDLIDTDDDGDDDNTPEFAKSQVNTFGRSKIHRGGMVTVYSKHTDPRRDPQYAARTTPRSNSRTNSSRSYAEDLHQRQLTHQQAGYPSVLVATTPTNAPPELRRNGSGSSDYSRDDLLNRMQQLAQVAETTYKTTRDNGSLLQDLQTQTSHRRAQAPEQQQQLESRNRFFYYQ